jgi:hypothetical protein
MSAPGTPSQADWSFVESWLIPSLSVIVRVDAHDMGGSIHDLFHLDRR